MILFYSTHFTIHVHYSGSIAETDWWRFSKEKFNKRNTFDDNLLLLCINRYLFYLKGCYSVIKKELIKEQIQFDTIVDYLLSEWVKVVIGMVGILNCVVFGITTACPISLCTMKLTKGVHILDSYWTALLDILNSYR